MGHPCRWRRSPRAERQQGRRSSGPPRTSWTARFVIWVRFLIIYHLVYYSSGTVPEMPALPFFCLHHRGFGSSWLWWDWPTWQPGNTRETRTTGWSRQTGRSGTFRRLWHVNVLPDIRPEGTLPERSQHVMLMTERRRVKKSHSEAAELEETGGGGRRTGTAGPGLNSQSHNSVRELQHCSNNALVCPEKWEIQVNISNSYLHFDLREEVSAEMLG